jgi:type I restriction enzyme S subunit
MSSEWQTFKLGEIGKIVTGKTPKTSNLDNFGGTVPFVTPTDMDGRKKISSTARYLTESGVLSVKNSFIPAGSIMVSCIGSDMGKSIIAGKDCVTNQQINSIVVKQEFQNEFIYYNLSMRKNELRNLASSGSTMPILNKSGFSEIEIKIPPFATQREITSILGALDDRLTLLRETNATLEAIAQALFKSWFVDFDPVHAKQQGRLPEGMDEQTAALFPDSFEESELGLVPAGWEVGTLGDMSKNNSAPFDFSKVEKVVFVNTGDVSNGEFLHQNYSSKEGLPGQAKKAIYEDDILFSEIRPKNGRFAYVNFDAKDYVVSTKFMVLRAINNIPPRYLYQVLKQTETIEYFNVIAESRSGTFPQITFDSVKNYKLIKPSGVCLDKYIECVNPIFHKVDLLNKQVQTLADLRDTLLPRLISGQLRVSDGEELTT